MIIVLAESKNGLFFIVRKCAKAGWLDYISIIPRNILKDSGKSSVL